MDQHGPALRVLRKSDKPCPEGKVCPAVIKVSTQSRHTAVIGKISGTPGTVYIPDDLIPEAVDLPAAPDRPGYRMIAGEPVTNIHEVAILGEHIGPGEAAILVRNEQIPEVLHDAA